MRKLRKIYVGVLLFMFPTWFARLFLLPFKTVLISRSAKVGFSLLIADRIEMGEKVRIGMFNFIRCSSINMKQSATIRHFNIIKGIFHLEMDEKTKINRNTTIVNSLYLPDLKKAYSVPTLRLGYNSIIGVNHFIDMTANVSLGKDSILAGRSSELWTHAFYHQHSGSGRYMVRGNINIGNNCYIGSHVIFNCGVTVSDSTTVGAGAIVSKNIGGGFFVLSRLGI